MNAVTVPAGLKKSSAGVANRIFTVIVDYNTTSLFRIYHPDRAGRKTMSKQTPFIHEIVSLVVMLLMAIALIATQADARLLEAPASGIPAVVVTAPEVPESSPTARIRANFEFEPMTITIDASADIGRLLRNVD
jgi:hypothetical protein